MATQMKDKVALVTGGASGIGAATARAFARTGASVIVSDVDDKAGRELTDDLNKDGEAIYTHANVGDASQVEQMVQAGLDAFGRLDYACNNAGIGGASAPTAEYRVEDWEKVIQINLTGVFYSLKYELAAMLESDGGAIVNLASILGQVGFQEAPAYVAAKHGLLGLTKSAALEYADQGVRVNAVCPAFIHTPLIADLEEDADTRDMLVGLHP
ncbi:MAG: SDR family NAD(P)-dependent oxidoreductase, partial [Anaerolineales bacterium]